MNKLDFSGINKIACKSFEALSEDVMDPILQAEFTAVEGPTPFDQQKTDPAEGKSPSPVEEPSAPIALEDERYWGQYIAAYFFHKRNNPPVVNREYWRGHIPEVDDIPAEEGEYWQRVTRDRAETSSAWGNDPFMVDLLTAAYKELERVYNCRRDKP